MALPVMPIKLPGVLIGQQNGRLPLAILVSTPGQAGGPVVRLVEPAARAWRALCAAARSKGHVLKATSSADSYRTYQQQVNTFTSRYQLDPIPDRPFRLWDSDNSGTPEKWWQLPNTAVAAVPGTSNHGYGLAVDTGEERDSDSGTESIDAATLAWLVANERTFGFSHEVQSEPWHIRYCMGDDIPAAVLAYEEEQLSTDNEFNADAHGWATTQLLPTYKVIPGATPPEANFTASNQLAAAIARMEAKLAAIESKIDSLEPGTGGVTLDQVRDEIAASTITPSA